MTDLEMTKLCAEAMGYKYYSGTRIVTVLHGTGEGVEYDPLHDDAQAMELVKSLGLNVCHGSQTKEANKWEVWPDNGPIGFTVFNADANRAIVECVAKMQRATTVSLRSARPEVEAK